jgi:transcriptional regulator with XRE-family HTH domain
VALRLSVRDFAEILGIPPRTVSKWEQAGAAREPRPHMQAILDTALERADQSARTRFASAVAELNGPSGSPKHWLQMPDELDREAWSDDIDRARLHADRQDFSFAARLMTRWLGRSEQAALDERDLYLKGQSLVVLGNVHRDQGRLQGSFSAQAVYRQAHAIYGALSLHRRTAQVELLLTVLAEMGGQHDASASRYRALADDGRLGGLDRARARLWVGTALSKETLLTEDRVELTTTSIRQAIREFEDLDEPDDWSVSHQKLALAHLANGDPSAAADAISVAIDNRRTNSPLQQVRLDTAHAHILCADPSTREGGLTLFDTTYAAAEKYELAHQMASINRIRKSLDPRTTRTYH